MIGLLALPKFGLSTVFIVAFISATLLPIGSEPAVFGLIKINPDMFWPAVLVASAGNTLATCHRPVTSNTASASAIHHAWRQ